MDNKQNKAKNVDANVAATTEEEWHEDWNDGTLEEVLASVEPKIFIHDIVDKENGGCDIDFETNKAFDEWYKKEKGCKRATKKGLSEFVKELLRKATDN